LRGERLYVSILIAFTFTLMLFLLAKSTYAQDYLYYPDYFLIMRPQLGFDISMRYNDDRRDRPDASFKNKSYLYTEKIDLKTRGWVYHPGLLVFELLLSPEWEQSIEKAEGSKSEGRSSTLGYSASFNILQYKPYSLNLSGERYITYENTAGASNIKTEHKKYDVTLNLNFKKKEIPRMMIEYTRSDTNKSGQFSSSSSSDQVSIKARSRTERSDTRLKAYYIDTYNRLYTTTINTLTREIDLENSYSFSGIPSHLSSRLSISEKRNEYFFERGYTLLETLFLRHRRNLSTTYTFNVDSYDQSEQRRENIGANFSLTHLLYENLTTTVNAGIIKNHTRTGQRRTYNASLDWAYVRRIPWGMINASVSHNYTMVDEKPNMRQLLAYNEETLTITTTTAEFLSNEHVETGTIEVYNEDETIRYDSGYRIVEIGNSVGIVCIPGGMIDMDQDCSDGATVSVHYEFIPATLYDYSQLDRSYGISVSLWDALRIYYNFTRSKQRFLRGEEPDNLSASETHTTGITLTYRWSTTSAYYRDELSTNNPTESWRFTEQLVFRPGKETYIFGGISLNRTRYKELTSSRDADRARSIRIGIQRVIGSPAGTFRIEGYHTTSKGITGHTIERGINSDLTLRFNVYTLSANYSFSYDEDRVVEDKFQNHRFLIKIKRELF